jgi:hypothetical protein
MKGFARYLVTDVLISVIKAIPALVMLVLAIWLIAGMLLSCSTKQVVAQDYYICEIKTDQILNRL